MGIQNMDKKAVNSRFRDQLPFSITVLGRGVTFSQSATGNIATHIEENYKDTFNSAKTRWDHRKGMLFDGPDQRSIFAAMKSRLRTKESLQRFLLFMIGQPIGLRLLIFDKSIGFKKYIGRQSAINEAYLTWDAIQNWEHDSKGHLKMSISCAGYRNRLAKYESDPDELRVNSVSLCMCSSNVSDSTGLCGTHKQSGSRNLFNHYPFFAVEGFPELAIAG